jgi:hypothetical protein
MAEARDLNHSYVGTEHLLLALIREEKGIAAQVLQHLGATLDVTRGEVMAILGPSPAPKPPFVDPSAPVRFEGPIGNIRIAVSGGLGGTVHREFATVQEAIAFLQQIVSGPSERPGQ